MTSDPLTPSPLSGPVDECAALRAVEQIREDLATVSKLRMTIGNGAATRLVADVPSLLARLAVVERDLGEARAQLAEARQRIVERQDIIADWMNAAGDARRRYASAEARIAELEAEDSGAVAYPDVEAFRAARSDASRWGGSMRPMPDPYAAALEVSPPEPEADEGCCDHSSGMDVYGCWDCRNTGHARCPGPVPAAAPEER